VEFLAWRHSGFSVYARPMAPEDEPKRLARSLSRPPLAPGPPAHGHGRLDAPRDAARPPHRRDHPAPRRPGTDPPPDAPDLRSQAEPRPLLRRRCQPRAEALPSSGARSWGVRGHGAGRATARPARPTRRGGRVRKGAQTDMGAPAAQDLRSRPPPVPCVHRRARRPRATRGRTLPPPPAREARNRWFGPPSLLLARAPAVLAPTETDVQPSHVPQALRPPPEAASPCACCPVRAVRIPMRRQTPRRRRTASHATSVS
jgi:hypothetical protein